MDAEAFNAQNIHNKTYNMLLVRECLAAASTRAAIHKSK